MGFLGVHPFDSSSTFNSRIANPVVMGRPNSLETLRKLVHATSLRRTKDLIRDELFLPDRMVVEEVVQFTTEEQRDYDVLKSRYGSILYEEGETDMFRRSTASIMQTIARLRQFCDHGRHLLPEKVHQLFDVRTTAETFSWSLFDALEVCAVCQTSVESSQSQCCLDCGHYLCDQCQKRTPDEETLVDIVCKLCDRDLAKPDSDSADPKIGCNADFRNYVPSSKVQALLKNLISERQDSPYQPIKRSVTLPPFFPSPGLLTVPKVLCSLVGTKCSI